MSVCFHLDEHISTGLAAALRHRGIDVTTTADAGLVGAAARDHLAFGAARALAELLGVQEVPGSNPGGATGTGSGADVT